MDCSVWGRATLSVHGGPALVRGGGLLVHRWNYGPPRALWSLVVRLLWTLSGLVPFLWWISGNAGTYFGQRGAGLRQNVQGTPDLLSPLTRTTSL